MIGLTIMVMCKWRIAKKVILPSDEAYILLLQPKKGRSTMTNGVCISISCGVTRGESSTNGATLSSFLKLVFC